MHTCRCNTGGACVKTAVVWNRNSLKWQPKRIGSQGLQNSMTLVCWSLGSSKIKRTITGFCTCAVNDGPHNLLSDCWPPAFLILVWCHFFEIVKHKRAFMRSSAAWRCSETVLVDHESQIDNYPVVSRATAACYAHCLVSPSWCSQKTLLQWTNDMLAPLFVCVCMEITIITYLCAKKWFSYNLEAFKCPWRPGKFKADD